MFIKKGTQPTTSNNYFLFCNSDQDGAEQDEPEELDFMFDEEMEQMDGRRNTFTDWSDEETDGEIDDHDVNKILIVTQTPPYLRKHPGGDRTGHHTSRAKLSSELVKVINDGLFYYEQDLWDDTYEPEYATIKVRSFLWLTYGWLFTVSAECGRVGWETGQSNTHIPR